MFVIINYPTKKAFHKALLEANDRTRVILIELLSVIVEPSSSYLVVSEPTESLGDHTHAALIVTHIWTETSLTEACLSRR